MKAKWHYSLHTTHSGRCILSPIRIIIIHLTLCMTSPCMCHCSFKKACCLHCVGEKLVVIITHYTFYIGYFTPCCRFKALFIFTYSDSSETLSGNLKGESEVVVCEYTDRGFSGALVNKHHEQMFWTWVVQFLWIWSLWWSKKLHAEFLRCTFISLCTKAFQNLLFVPIFIQSNITYDVMWKD